MSINTGNESDARSEASGFAHEFPVTRWSLVARAAGRLVNDGNDDERRREALGVLLTRYLPALRAHLLRRRIASDRADDLLQSFIADKVIGSDLLAAADRERGRFRALLVTALNNFAANRVRHDRAERRAPKDGVLVPLEPAVHDDCRGRQDCDPFDVEWARGVLAEALRRTREQCVACGRLDLWEVLEVRLLGPALRDEEPMGYAEMVKRHGYASPKHAANALVTAKRRFEQAVRGVLAEYVADERELELELVALGQALGAAAHLPGFWPRRTPSGRGYEWVRCAHMPQDLDVVDPSAEVSGADATRLWKLWPRAAPQMTWLPEELGAVLRHQLTAPLDGPAPIDSHGTAVAAPATYADLLLHDPNPPLDILRSLKDWAKPFTFRDDGELPREVAGVFYYAAILVARLRCGHRISELDDARLAKAAAWALQLIWLDPSIGAFFAEALAALRREAPPQSFL